MILELWYLPRDINLGTDYKQMVFKATELDEITYAEGADREKKELLSTMLGNIFWSGLKGTRQKFCQTMPHILWISIFLSPHLPGPTSYPLLKTIPYDTAVLLLPTYPFSRFFPGSSSFFYFWNSITPGPTLSPSLSLSCMSVLLCMYTHTFLLKDYIYSHNLNCQLYSENFQMSG